MGQAGILIFDGNVVRSRAMASGIGRLGFVALTDDAEDADAAIVDAALLAPRPTLLTDLRRRSPDILIALIVEANAVEEAGLALGIDRLSFLAESPDDGALALALAPLGLAIPPGFAESDAGYGLRLAALGEEIARIARAIEPPASLSGAPPVPEAPLAFDPAFVRALLKARRQRDSATRFSRRAPSPIRCGTCCST